MKLLDNITLVYNLIRKSNNIIEENAEIDEIEYEEIIEETLDSKEE